MRLPTRAEVDTAGRYATAAIGTAVTILGLQAKGVSLDQVKLVIQAAGDTINQIAVLVAASMTLYAGVRGVFKSSPTQQAISVEQAGSVIVASPELAAATPNNPNIVSQDDFRLVQK